MRTRGAARMLLGLVAAVGLAGTPVGPTAPAVVRAATPDLTIVSDARYDVQPDKGRIHVTADLTLRNRLKDTTTRRYFFDYAFIDVLPRASGFRLTTDGAGSPSVRVVSETTAYTRLRLSLGRQLRSGATATYRLSFSMEDPGGAATRDLRVGDSLVSFPVWAFATADTPGSSVTVVFPKGYDIEVEAGDIPAPATLDDGRSVLRSGRLERPLEFFAYVVGSRPGAFEEQTIRPIVQGESVAVTVSAWSDDAPWGARVAGLLSDALPVLGTEIGLPWPVSATPLTVQESISRSTGGYAGRYDPGTGIVEVAYYAGDFVVLHEAAHVWFNGSLLADRWANEAFASYYATRTATVLARDVGGDELTDEMQAARIPLNGWGPVGEQDPAQEEYAYAASLALAQAIAARAGDEALRAVWADARDGIGAYQPLGGDAEIIEEPPDWRGLLDLLEARTGDSYDDLWRDWVARPTDLVLLDARAAARDRYEQVVDKARDWRLPQPIREALRAWRFGDATALLDDAVTVLDARTEVTSAAEAAGLVPPDGLRLAFEDPDGFDDATTEASAEFEIIKRYVSANDLRPIEPTPLVMLGLWGTTPDVDLAEARTAFARGDYEAAVEATDDAAAAWGSAESIGQSRAISIGLLALAAVLALALMMAASRRRRRRRVTMQATRVRG